MKTYFGLFVALFVACLLLSNASAQSVTFDALVSEAAKDAILADEEITVISTAVFRAGGSASFEIGIGNGETLTDFNSTNLVWDINGQSTLTLSYDSNTGNLNFFASTNGNSDSVLIQPTDWFDQILFTLDTTAAEYDINGTIHDENFNLFTPFAPDQWDGILISLPDNNSSNVDSFSMAMTMDISTVFPTLGQDDFRGEIYLLQGSVPEPSSYAIIMAFLALAYVTFSRRRS